MKSISSSISRLLSLILLVAVSTACLWATGCTGAPGQASSARVDRLERSVSDLGKEVAALRGDIAAMNGRPTAAGTTSATGIGRTRTSGDVKITRVSKNVNLVEGVTGQGLSAKAAMDDAQRRAVEAGARVYINSQSTTEDFELIRDTIYARSAGFVEDVKILSKSADADGIHTVKINAKVSIAGIENFWGATRALLERVGNPKIVVSIQDTIADKVQAASIVQARTEALLIKSGFLLADKEQLARIMAGRPASETHKVAGKLGAQLAIVGTVEAKAQTPSKVGDVWLYKYEATGTLRCYRSDTGRLVSSQAGRGRGVATAPEVAAMGALSAVADDVAKQIQTDILYHWKDILERQEAGSGS